MAASLICGLQWDGVGGLCSKGLARRCNSVLAPHIGIAVFCLAQVSPLPLFARKIQRVKDLICHYVLDL